MSGCRATKHTMRSAWLTLLCLVGSCTATTNLVSLSGDAAELDAGAEHEAGAEDAEAGEADASMAQADANSIRAYCGATRLCQCSNGIDDDKDGHSDGFDAECTSPYDDDEGSFATGDDKPGNPNCADCVFRAKPGAGNDSCTDIAASCLIDGTSSSGTGRCRSCTATTACKDSCLPRTPNGCDCFGCCLVQHEGQSLTVRLGEACKVGSLNNPSACSPCMPATTSGCYNPCDECELCLGKTEADLPDKCRTDAGTPSYTCSMGRPCRTDGACGSNTEYCLQGCCVQFLL